MKKLLIAVLVLMMVMMTAAFAEADFAALKGEWVGDRGNGESHLFFDGAGGYYEFDANNERVGEGELAPVDEYDDGAAIRYDLCPTGGEVIPGFYVDSETELHFGNGDGMEYVKQEEHKPDYATLEGEWVGDRGNGTTSLVFDDEGNFSEYDEENHLLLEGTLDAMDEYGFGDLTYYLCDKSGNMIDQGEDVYTSFFMDSDIEFHFGVDDGHEYKKLVAEPEFAKLEGEWVGDRGEGRTKLVFDAEGGYTEFAENGTQMTCGKLDWFDEYGDGAAIRYDLHPEEGEVIPGFYLDGETEICFGNGDAPIYTKVAE